MGLPFHCYHPSHEKTSPLVSVSPLSRFSPYPLTVPVPFATVSSPWPLNVGVSRILGPLLTPQAPSEGLVCSRAPRSSGFPHAPDPALASPVQNSFFPSERPLFPSSLAPDSPPCPGCHTRAQVTHNPPLLLLFLSLLGCESCQGTHSQGLNSPLQHPICPIQSPHNHQTDLFERKTDTATPSLKFPLNTAFSNVPHRHQGPEVKPDLALPALQRPPPFFRQPLWPVPSQSPPQP